MFEIVLERLGHGRKVRIGALVELTAGVNTAQKARWRLAA
jgi:hypothetical protein